MKSKLKYLKKNFDEILILGVPVWKKWGSTSPKWTLSQYPKQ